jgi:SWI/SNF-related matrix-associated actin-dependent regulator of chromatin subfamily B member 1
MPSPPSSELADAAHQNHQNDSSIASQNGVVSTDDHDTLDSSGAQDTVKDTAIEEGKEKAKAVMAAAGVPVSSDPGEEQRQPSDASAGQAVNGTVLTRKRSRSGSRIPARSQSPAQTHGDQPSVNEYLLHKYIERDQLHAGAMNDAAEFTRKLFASKNEELAHFQQVRFELGRNPVAVGGRIFGDGYNGFGNDKTSRGMGIVYPSQRRRAGHRKSRELHVSKKNANQQAEFLEELVPIRLDIELDKLKLRDTFTWNLHDRIVPPELFAETMVEDFRAPPEVAPALIDTINREIREQIQDFYPHVFIEEEPLDPHLPYSAYKNDEMRILIKLNITIGGHTLVDRFEWEINNPLNNPEEFARQMSWELSLSGEFTTAIAHSIREQCQMFTRSLYITGHPFDGRPIEDADVRDGFLSSPLSNVFRPMQSAKDYQPYLYELTDADLQREELSILREQRRAKRSVTRRGGPALPDLKDRARTVRTMVVSSVLPGAAENVETSRLFKLSQRSGRGRRPGARLDGSDSDGSESEDSGPDSPAANLLGGTSRTRAMRGAANAAQQAMRANLGRSATPEIMSLHHHETRTSARRFGQFDTPGRDESVAPPTSLMVKLRISKDKFRRLVQSLGKRRPEQLHPAVSALQSQANTPRVSNAALPSATATPSPAPGRAKSEGSPKKQQQQQQQPPSVPANDFEHQEGGEKSGIQYYADGRADAPFPQPPDSVRRHRTRFQHNSIPTSSPSPPA